MQLHYCCTFLFGCVSVYGGRGVCLCGRKLDGGKWNIKIVWINFLEIVKHTWDRLISPPQKAYNDHNVFLFVCIVYTLHFELDIMWTFSIQSLFIQNKIFECDNNVDPKEIWNRIDQRRACTKTSFYTEMLRADYVQLSQILFHLFICLFVLVLIWVLHLILFVCLCLFVFNKIMTLVTWFRSLSFNYYLNELPSFYLSLLHCLLSFSHYLWLSIAMVILKSMLFCQFCWRIFSSSKLFKHILCALQILQLLAILKANTFHLNILWLFGWLCIHMFVLCF